MAQTWTELLDDLKTLGAVPTSQNLMTEARMLSLANAMMRTKIVPLMSEIREGYYSYDIDTALNATGIYNISRRAAGGKILDAKLINGDDVGDLTRYWEEDVENMDTAPGATEGFYVKRNQIILLPKAPGGWTYLRQVIMLRPLEIVAQDSAAQVTAIDTVTGVVTCETVPSTWTTSNTFDIVQAESHFDTIAIDLTISAVTTGSAGTLTFTPSALPSRLSVGDWIGLAGQSPVVQCEMEVQPYLALLCAHVCLRSLGAMEKAKELKEDAKEMREEVLSILTPRVENEGKKLVNRTGILRRGVS